MQSVEAPHEREVGFRHWPRQVVDAATADVQSFRLLGDRQIVCTVDHRFALSRPALLSIVLQRQPPDLCVQRLHVESTCADPVPPPGPNTSVAPPSSCAFHDVI